MNRPGGMVWFIRHELRLAWRDFIAMATAGRQGREKAAIAFILAIAAVLHAVAWLTLPVGAAGTNPGGTDRLVTITAMLTLPLALMVSQAMETVTRLFYSRSDLDLVLASPAPLIHVFAVRVLAIAAATTAMALLLGAPVINVLAVREHAGWLAAYPVLVSLGVISTVISLWLTFGLFYLIGARNTRLAAQIAAALVGAAFVIGIQLAAIGSMGTLSRITYLASADVQSALPGGEAILWYPARAMTGEPGPLVVVVASAGVALLATLLVLPRRFADIVVATAGAASGGTAKSRMRQFQAHTARSALRRKEWKLLLRDHWLISQSLMQIFYLVPPAFMLWKGFGGEGAAPAVVVPILVMAAGQLAGGLAWLAISGEDAHELVATAPVARGAILFAKVEAVLTAVALLVCPILLALAFVNPVASLAALAGVVAASVSATAIQLWFRSQARRSNFRRRQTSSRIATFAEAFSSIFWAGAAGLTAHGSWYALPMALAALAVLGLVRRLAPRPVGEFA